MGFGRPRRVRMPWWGRSGSCAGIRQFFSCALTRSPGPRRRACAALTCLCAADTAVDSDQCRVEAASPPRHRHGRARALVGGVSDDGPSASLKRVLLAGQPPLPAPGRSRLHHRGEAPKRQPGDQRRPLSAGPLHRDRRHHAGQGSPGVGHRAVRDLPQPRRRHPRRATSASNWSPTSPS